MNTIGEDQFQSLSRWIRGFVGLTVWLARGLAAQEPAAWRLVTPEGHTDAVAVAAFSSDGRFVVTASRDLTARVWEVTSGRETQRFQGHTGWLSSAAFSPDGHFVVTASRDSTARVWDVASGRELQRFEGHTTWVSSAAFSPDGRFVVTASAGDATARLWEVASGLEVQRFQRHPPYRVFSAAFSPDGRLVVTGHGDGTTLVWEVATGREVRRFEGHTDWVESAAFSPDGRFVVTASLDETDRVWEVASGREVHRFEGHNEFSRVWSWSATFSPDGRFVVTADQDRTARIWEVASGQHVQSFYNYESVNSAAFSPDGRFVVAASDDRTARIWEVASGRAVQRFGGHPTAQESFTSFSPDGRFVVTVQDHRRTIVWEVASGRELQRFQEYNVSTAAFSPDGRFVVRARTDEFGAKVWEVASGREVQRFEGHEDWVTSVAFSPDGRFVVTAYFSPLSTPHMKPAVLVWEVASGQEVQRFEGHTAKVNSAAFSPNGRFVVTASYDGTARIWEVATGREVQRLQGNAVAFSPDGRLVATDWGVWDVASGREVQRFDGHRGVNSTAFSPDGRFVVTASYDRTARMWEVASGREVQRFQGHSNEVVSAGFSSDGRFLLTASRDGTTRVWDPRTGNELFRRILVDSTDSVLVAPDGRFDGTEGGIPRMYYTRAGQTIGLDAFFEAFYTPGLSGLVLSGSSYTGPDIRKGFGRPPSVRILSPRFGDTVQASMTVAVAVTDQGGGAEDTRLYHNGALVAGTTTRSRPIQAGCPAAAICFQVDLLPGVNILEASAFSTSRLEADRSRVTVMVAGSRPSATLHIVAVGINTYENAQYSLNYGRADAKAFVDSVRAGSHGIFAQVAIDTLYDTAASGLAIKAAFRRVAARAKLQDVFVFYYAGHGVAQQIGDSGRFYLIPSDVTQMSDAEQLAQRAVSNLQELFEAVPARKKLMLIDACQSGQALVGFAQRGTVEEQAIARLARASGIFVMAAAGSDQFASEVATLGHGVFTYAWLRAMAAETAGPRERLVGALASEVERLIPELSKSARTRKQYPIVFRNGQDFPLVVR